MKWTVIFIAITAAACYGQDVIAQDSAGLVVTLKEKYGTYYSDTATVVTMKDGAVWLTHRNSPTAVFPLSNWAIVSIWRDKNGDE